MKYMIKIYMFKLIMSIGIIFSIIGCDNRKVLYIYCWSDYINPQIILKFEKEHNCRVIIDTFDSNESMFAKLKAGCTGYDIIVPSSYQVKQLAKEGLIEKLNHKYLPIVNMNFCHDFDTQILDPELKYSVPYAMTYTGIMYDKKRISNIDINTWKSFNNDIVRGKCTLLDDMREVIGVGLMTLGYSINSTNSNEISEAADYIISIRNNIRKFDAESYKVEVANGSSWFSQGYSSDAFQVIFGDNPDDSRDDIGFAYPCEGFSIAWDEFCILTASEQKQLAYAFIDYMYTTDAAIFNMMYTYSMMANAEIFKAAETNAIIKRILDELMPSYEQEKSGQVIQSFFDQPNVQKLYNDAWDKIRAINK